jgi:hypothetical protein
VSGSFAPEIHVTAKMCDYVEAGTACIAECIFEHGIIVDFLQTIKLVFTEFSL